MRLTIEFFSCDLLREKLKFPCKTREKSKNFVSQGCGHPAIKSSIKFLGWPQTNHNTELMVFVCYVNHFKTELDKE